MMGRKDGQAGSSEPTNGALLHSDSTLNCSEENRLSSITLFLPRPKHTTQIQVVSLTPASYHRKVASNKTFVLENLIQQVPTAQ